MSPILIFILLLIVTFLLLLYFLKPTSIEAAVEERLAGLKADRRTTSDGGTILRQHTLSVTPWLDPFIKQLPFSNALDLLISQAGKDYRVGSVILACSGLALVSGWVAAVFTGSDLIAGAAGIVVGSLPIVVLYTVRGHRFRKFDDLLPEAVDLMSRGLRAGHSIAAVMEMVGNEIADPVGSEFRAMHKEQTLGLPMRDAITNMVDRMPRDDMRFIATAILLQKESGGNLAQILDKTSILVRERARLRGQLRIYTAQGRITGWILGLAPFAMFGLISVVNRNYTKVLFTEPMGIHMVEGALVMMVLGVLVIRKIIDIRV